MVKVVEICQQLEPKVHLFAVMRLVIDLHVIFCRFRRNDLTPDRSSGIIMTGGELEAYVLFACQGCKKAAVPSQDSILSAGLIRDVCRIAILPSSICTLLSPDACFRKEGIQSRKRCRPDVLESGHVVQMIREITRRKQQRALCQRYEVADLPQSSTHEVAFHADPTPQLQTWCDLAFAISVTTVHERRQIGPCIAVHCTHIDDELVFRNCVA